MSTMGKNMQDRVNVRQTTNDFLQMQLGSLSCAAPTTTSNLKVRHCQPYHLRESSIQNRGPS